MNKKNMMRDFINIINNRRLMTSFIKNIFGYKNFFDYNYIFRSTDKDNELIIDIYDNVTENRFNRYIFNFDNCNYTYEKKLIDNIHIHYISVLNVKDNDNNLIKLAFLFNLEKDKMIEYAKTFLDKEFIITIKDIIK
jgi:hypothetical protein